MTLNDESIRALIPPEVLEALDKRELEKDFSAFGMGGDSDDAYAILVTPGFDSVDGLRLLDGKSSGEIIDSAWDEERSIWPADRVAMAFDRLGFDVTVYRKNPTPIVYMDIGEFREAGFLQEANRLFFHPLGLALSMHTGFDRESMAVALREAGIQFGEDARDCCWTLVTVLGLDKPHLSSVWDYRDDPEGMLFGPDQIDPAKIAAVKEERDSHLDVRQELPSCDGNGVQFQ